MKLKSGNRCHVTNLMKEGQQAGGFSPCLKLDLTGKPDLNAEARFVFAQ